jgi:DNA-binding response OmpR family regulator
MSNRILIIEDETELSGLIKKFLSKRAYDVTCVENLTSAILLIQSNSFDAIILDNNLPDGKGLDIIPTINYAQNKPKIIAMSAIQVRDEALKAGASHYMEKPISMAAIYKLLNN